MSVTGLNDQGHKGLNLNLAFLPITIFIACRKTMQRHLLPFGKTESLTSSKWSQKVSQINFFANKCDFQATINNFVLPSSWQG